MPQIFFFPRGRAILLQIMIKVLATDLDGTLFYPKKPVKLVHSKNKALVREFITNGGRVVLVSSRAEPFLNKVKQRLDAEVDFIGCDGTFINIGGKHVFENTFDPEKSKQMIMEIRNEFDPGLILMATKEHPAIMTRTRVSRVSNVGYFLYEAFQGAYREPWIRSDHFFYSELAKGGVRKLMILIGITKKKKALAEKLTNVFAERYPEFEFMWLNQFIEVTPKGCSKAAGVTFYLDYLGLNHDNVLVVGDSGNDAPMFEAFYENSYCMSHASDSVKAKAAHVIDHVFDLYPVLCPSVGSAPSSNKEG